MFFRLLLCIAITFFTSPASAHSMMSEPQSTSPKVCRIGGDPNPGDCPGPCDLTAVRGGWANFDSPSNPAAVYRRGQRITVKYQRNNHGPGGFVRHTLVPVHEMMNKHAHERNAFHYSCFGATPVKASQADVVEDRWGYNIVGNDGSKETPGFYETKVTIPSCVPDGDYVFGWVWYGGTGGDVSNKEYTSPPFNKGYFTDYWSCSYVRVEGGDAVQSSCMPEFVNDMNKWSSEGCMSANDAPGVCRSEPCIVLGAYQKPRPFKDGNVPAPLTPNNFISRTNRNVASGIPLPVSVPREHDEVSASNMTLGIQKGSCRCLGAGTSCGRKVERKTRGNCLRRTAAGDQPRSCIDACCSLCQSRDGSEFDLCADREVRSICQL